MAELFDCDIIDNAAIKLPSIQQTAVHDGNNNDWPWPHSDITTMEEINLEITPINMNKWNTFYN